jgi:uncharacterized protein (TIGR00251 family)
MVKVKVKVVPNSKQQKVEKISEDEYKVYVKSPPTKGKANKELIEVLSDYFNVSKSRIKIISGFASREKIVEIL